MSIHVHCLKTYAKVMMERRIGSYNPEYVATDLLRTSQWIEEQLAKTHPLRLPQNSIQNRSGANG